ncbi:MAG: hypothetical protein H6819_12945 [Phycisphaerales bacterium]|nr:hypothetical protein [Phycisphaerales bacterium]MCB9856740.1 hypothetical protein [Phycisphaerales bacterium]MCB9862133.1 hypothetical protein [Phycisphaerales bacterium]
MASRHDDAREGILRRDLLFARFYLWFIAASAFDIVMTALVLSIGGYEANPMANFVIARFGLHGALAYKFALAILVIFCCEIIGRRDRRTGRAVAGFAIVMPAMAAVLGGWLIFRAAGGDALVP